MNRYSYKQSIRDGATNPVKFEPRLAKLRVNREAIDAEFKRLVEKNNLDDDDKWCNTANPYCSRMARYCVT